tara:strand:+ start:35283 stop:36413 length:1131 start_codon:yes stop_codon:yes gene_type:complete
MKDNKTIAQIYREMHLINEGLSPNVSKAAKALKAELQKETNVAKKMKMADDVMREILGEEAIKSLYGKETPGQEKRIDLAIDGVPGVGGEIKKQQPLLGSGIKEDQSLSPESLDEFEVKRADRAVVITKDGQKKMKPKAELAVEEEHIDEVSSSMLRRYVDKAGRQGDAGNVKRQDGESLAAKKITKNPKVKVHATEASVELDELSRDTLASYQKKASDARGHRGLPIAKVDNRYKGVSQASKKLAAKESVDEASDLHIKQAKGIAFDKRYKGGNMTGATNAIEKMKKGLSNHPEVRKALQHANESTENTMQEEQTPTGVQIKHVDKKTGQTHATTLFTARDAMQHEKDLKKDGHKIHSRAAVYGTKVGPERLMSK